MKPAMAISPLHPQPNTAKPNPSFSAFISSKKNPSKMVVSVSCKARNSNLADKTYQANDYYKLLSLSQNSASTEEIKRAYRAMALRYHPDVSSPSMKDESTRIFVQLNEAYKTLSDPDLRREYDYEMGLRNHEWGFKQSNNSGMCRRQVWEEQMVELKRRSYRRMGQKEGSWGCRMRPKNLCKKD